jgi:hypothetical protein
VNPLYRPIPVMNIRMGAVLPSWRMAEGTLAAPAVPAAAQGALQGGIDKIISSLTTEVQALGVEVDLVSPAAIRVDPTSASEISNIGNLAPQEIRTAISASAQQLGGLISRVLTGALAPYVSPDQSSQLTALKGQVDEVNLGMQNQDTMPIAPADQTAVQAYLDSHANGPSAAISDAEKGVVTAEAGSVPVLEPSEQDVPVKIAIGVGLAAVAGLILWHVLG